MNLAISILMKMLNNLNFYKFAHSESYAIYTGMNINAHKR